MNGVRKFRMFAGRGRQHVKLATVSWSNADTSLYIVPTSTESPPVGYVGRVDVPRGSPTAIDYTRQGFGRNPYLSIHERGRIHAKVDGHQGTPVDGPPLTEYGGGHIATVVVKRTDGLPVLEREPRGGREPDVVLLDPDASGLALHVPVFVGTEEDDLADCPLRLRMLRPSMAQPLHFGFRVRGEDPDPMNENGVMVMSGWGNEEPTGSYSVVYAVTR